VKTGLHRQRQEDLVGRPARAFFHARVPYLRVPMRVDETSALLHLRSHCETVETPQQQHDLAVYRQALLNENKQVPPDSGSTPV